MGRCDVEAAVSAAKAKVIQECRRHACRYSAITSARGRRPAFAKATAWLEEDGLLWCERGYDFFEARISA